MNAPTSLYMYAMNLYFFVNQRTSNKKHWLANIDPFSEGKGDIPMLLEAQAYIFNHLYNFINSMSLKFAVELGIPDIIHNYGKPISFIELISALSIHPTKAHCIPRLMRILVHSGFFARQKINSIDGVDDEEEGYILTKTCQLLLRDHPFSVTPFLQATIDPIISKPWHCTSAWLRNEDASPFELAHGMSYWDYIAHDPKLTDLFKQGMKSDSLLITTALLNRGKEAFDGVNSVVDVGGGSEIPTKLIVESFPNIQCKVLDLPHVVAGSIDTPNVKYVAGDMFEWIPPADVVMLKWILHNWNDEKCLKILRKCKEAVKGREGGKLIIIEMVIKENRKEDYEATETKLFFDILMMVHFNGKERTEKDWAKLISDAGFSGYKITPILGLRSLIEVYP